MSAGDKSSPENSQKGRKRPFLGLVRGTTLTLDWSGRLIVVACLAAMFVALLVNVVLRYALGSGISWAYEIHALLLPWLVAGGLVIASARGRNIAITIMPDMLEGRSVLVLNLIIQSIILVICLSVLWSSQPILKASQFQSLSTLGVKQVWGYASLVYAFGAMAVIAALGIVRTLSGEDVTDHDPGHASLS
ncbi:TRAP transporter small permease [Antarctobacter sp.]|uniref:TRAP transporter small permease n=1 Tax=Antarctobacter sp. TaxID=1872577 RepID=UPI003A946228